MQHGSPPSSTNEIHTEYVAYAYVPLHPHILHTLICRSILPSIKLHLGPLGQASLPVSVYPSLKENGKGDQEPFPLTVRVTRSKDTVIDAMETLTRSSLFALCLL